MSNIYDGQNDLLLIGAGGHAKVIIDTIGRYHSQYNIIGIAEKDEPEKAHEILGVPVIGTDAILDDLYGKGLRKVFISIGMVNDYRPRLRVYDIIKSMGYECINVIHGTSIISGHAVLGQGNAVLAGAIINTEANIGNNCIVNTGSIIEHECVLGNNVHVAPGAKISGHVFIGDNCLIGVGASVIQGIKIGKNSIIGAGSVVINDIPPDSVAVGVPAGVIRKR